MKCVRRRPHLLMRNALILIVLFLSGGYLILSCSTWRTVPEKPSDRKEKSRKEILEEEKQVLLAETNRLLALSEEKDGQAYRDERQRFESALRDYLQTAQISEDDLILFHRQGTVIILPVELVKGEPLPVELRDVGTPVTLWKQIGPPLKGKILDLAALPDTSFPGGTKTAILFPDSLLVMDFAGADSLQSVVYHFTSDDFSNIRPLFLNGIMGELDQGNQRKLAVLTSAMKSPLVFRWDNSTLQRVTPDDTTANVTYPGNWISIAGQALYRNPDQNLKAFLSARNLPDTQYYVLLDDTGYLHLLSKKANDLVWSSERPWGNKLYVLGDNLVAVTNDITHSFAGFRYNGKKLLYLGQSPDLQGKIFALSKSDSVAVSGILAGVERRSSNNQYYNRLEFIPLDALHWQTDGTVPIPQFPSYYNSEIKFVIPSEHLQGSSQLTFPASLRSNLFETLVRIDSTGTPQNWLAASLTASKNSRDWTIVLRKDIRFPDGEQLTAQAIVDGWTNLWRHTNEASDYSSWLWQDIEGASEFQKGDRREISGLQVLDQFTLRIHLARSLPLFAEHLAQPVFQIRRLDTSNPYPVGTGAFHIKEIRQNDRLDMLLCQRNRFYHEGMPPLETIRFSLQNAAPADSLSNARSTGGIIRRKKDLQYFRKISSAREQSFPARTLYFLAINPTVSPLDDAGKRGLIVTALDRRVTSEIIDDAECTPLYHLFTTQDTQTLRAPPAQQESPNQPLRITFYEADPIARQIAERLAARLSQLKIANQLLSILSIQEFSRIRTAKDYDILVDSYSPRYTHPTYDLIQLLERGYNVPSGMLTELHRIITREAWNQEATLEKSLIEGGVIYPVLMAKSYIVLPANLRDVRLSGANRVNFSRAWYPRR